MSTTTLLHKAYDLYLDEKVDHVRTPAGERKFKQKIGSIIVAKRKLRNLTSLEPEWDFFERVQGSNGRIYSIGVSDRHGGKWVATDDTDGPSWVAIVEGTSEEQVYDALDTFVGGGKPQSAGKPAAPVKGPRGGKGKGTGNREDDYGPIQKDDRVVVASPGGRSGSAKANHDGKEGTVISTGPKNVVVQLDDGSKIKASRNLLRRNNSGLRGQQPTPKAPAPVAAPKKPNRAPRREPVLKRTWEFQGSEAHEWGTLYAGGRSAYSEAREAGKTHAQAMKIGERAGGRKPAKAAAPMKMPGWIEYDKPIPAKGEPDLQPGDVVRKGNAGTDWFVARVFPPGTANGGNKNTIYTLVKNPSRVGAVTGNAGFSASELSIVRRQETASPTLKHDPKKIEALKDAIEASGSTRDAVYVDPKTGQIQIRTHTGRASSRGTLYHHIKKFDDVDSALAFANSQKPKNVQPPTKVPIEGQLSVGQRVDTEYGGGKVTAHTGRSVTIDLDDGQTINVQTGTPGYRRIKPNEASRKDAATIAKTGIRTGHAVSQFGFTMEQQKKLQKEVLDWIESASLSELNALLKEFNAYGRKGGLNARDKATARLLAEQIRKLIGKKADDMEPLEFKTLEEYDAYVEYTKRMFTAEQREAAHTLPGGGYPIENVEDLKNAIHAIGRAKDRAATIAHIKKRAKALGREDLIPEQWG